MSPWIGSKCPHKENRKKDNRHRNAREWMLRNNLTESHLLCILTKFDFDQQMGASNYVCWAKSFLLALIQVFHLFRRNRKKRKKKCKNNKNNKKTWCTKKGVCQHLDGTLYRWLTPKRWLTPGEIVLINN